MHLPKPRSIVILLALFLAVFLYIYPDVIRAQSIPTTLSVGSLNANPGDTINLPILISTTTSMRGYQFDLNFDPTRLQVANSSPLSVYDSGWMLSSAGNGTNLIKANSPMIDNVNGTIRAAAWALLSGPGFGAQGSGTLTYIRLTIPANAPNGMAWVNLDNVLLADVNGNQIDDVQVVNSWVQIGGGTNLALKRTNSSSKVMSQQAPIQNLWVVPLNFGNGPMLPSSTNVANGSYPLRFVLHGYFRTP